MNFSKLHVLHLYGYHKPKGEKSLLSTFTQKVNPLILSTCMRHLYIFSSNQLASSFRLLSQLKLVLDNPEQHQTKTDYDHLTGLSAYAFLLYWVVGGLNKKKPFNDPRILGQLRDTIRKVSTNQSQRTQASWMENRSITLSLLEDARHLCKWVSEQLPDHFDDKENIISAVCKRCAWARSMGVLHMIKNVDYKQFVNHDLMLAHLYEKLDDLKQKTITEHKKQYDRYGDIGFIFSQTMANIQNKIQTIEEMIALIESKISSKNGLMHPHKN